jgi:SPP1 gp7 family putative phage head morphogenesis protein
MKNKNAKKLSTALTQHCDDLQIYANGVAEDAVSEFADSETAIMEIIYLLYAKFHEKGIPKTYAIVKYLESVKEKLTETRNISAQKVLKIIQDSTDDITKNESKWLYAFFSALAIGAGVSRLQADTYRKIAKYGIYNGNTQKQLVEKILSGDSKRIYEAAIKGLKDGATLAELRSAVRSEMLKTRRYVKLEVESVINGVVNDSTLAFAAVNDANLMYVAVLDMSVCEECASHDGEIYSPDDPAIPGIPRHFDCRCRLIPVPFNQVHEIIMPFSDYFLTLAQSEQRERLGRAKYNSWKLGQYVLKAYEAPPAGLRITIDELRERDIEALA